MTSRRNVAFSVSSSILLWALTILVAITPWSVQPVNAGLTNSYWEGVYLCKCICFGANYTILPIYKPTNPEKPCLTCTKQWCLDQKLPICVGADIGGTNPDTGTGKEGDVEGRCFQRYFPRDQIVVTLFIIVVVGLLLAAAVRRRMERTGYSFGNAPRSGTRWREMFFPARPAPPASPLFDLDRQPSPTMSPSNSRGYSVVSREGR
ncbi:hypothetical protein M407DRAFT_243975 [Tulasnella calospora MUT 4182]|uniref:Uncharacterized protein n=1 Tax=Tulasnella calospora MUT 4182 TaxID=1051891 RepID=A0A0C3QII1_9AGAM|nr:hypothetical protein M407DRAFT_243975 [Tulasnella calospora MUT 4182]